MITHHIVHKGKFLIGAVLAVLLIANMILFAQTVRISDQLVKMEERTKSLRLENEQLSYRLQSMRSLDVIEDYAPLLGLTASAQALRLDKNPNVASLR